MARLDTLTYLQRPRLVSLHIFLELMSVSKFIIKYFFDLYLRYALCFIILLVLIVIVVVE